MLKKLMVTLLAISMTIFVMSCGNSTPSGPDLATIKSDLVAAQPNIGEHMMHTTPCFHLRTAEQIKKFDISASEVRDGNGIILVDAEFGYNDTATHGAQIMVVYNVIGEKWVYSDVKPSGVVKKLGT